MLLQWFLFISIALFLSFIVQFMMNPLQSQAESDTQFRVLFLSQILASFCLVPLFIGDALKLSNRFVGPIVRLQSYLRKVESTDCPPLSFRAGDYWDDLPADVNGMFSRLRESGENVGDENLIVLADRKSKSNDCDSLQLAKTDL